MGLFLLGAPSAGLTAFNGGRSQTAMNFLGYGNDYPFINVLKTMQGWTATADQLDPRNYDVNGYPDTLTGTIYTIMYVPTQARRPGRWAITWDSVGSTTLYCQGFTLDGTDPATGSKTTSGATGRYEFRPGAGINQLTVGITGASPGNKITNLQVFHVGDEADLLAGEVYTADFKNKLIEMNPGVLRYGDWMQMNKTQITTWATNKPVGYIHYSSKGEMRPSICAGITSGGSGDDYAITFNDPVYGSGAPVDKQTLIIRFDRNSVGTTPTLNLNATGAVPMSLPSGATMSTFTSRKPIINTWATLVFDAGLNVWIKRGGDSEDASYFLENAVPPEIFMRLCKEVGAHPWWNMPMLASDPLTDYITELAQYNIDYSESWMIPRYEGPNETWNTSSNAFNNGTYANQKQLVWNGGATTYGSAVTYPVTNVSWTGSGATGTATLTVTGTLPPMGARIALTTGSGWGDLGGGWDGTTVHVVARNSGAGTIQINRAPGFGTNPSAVTEVLTPNSTDYGNWYGRVMSMVGQEINSVYGSPIVSSQTDYQVMIGLKTHEGGAEHHAPRIGSTSYSIAQGTNNSPNLTVCAYNWATHIAVANYMTPTMYTQLGEVLMAYRLAGGDATAADDYCDTLNTTSGSLYGLSQTKAAYAARLLNATSWGGVSGYAQAPYSAGGGSVTLRMGAYEGGYSPDFTTLGSGSYPTGAPFVTSTVTAATKGATTIITLPNTTVHGIARVGMALDADSVTVGAQLSFTGWPTGWTALNTGNYLVLSLPTSTTAEIQFNSSAIVQAFSGTPVASYVGPALSVICGANATASRMLDELRSAAKFSTHLEGYTYGGYLGSNSNYQNFLDEGGEFPSQFFFCAPSTNAAETQPVGNGSCWGMLTNIYDVTASTSFDAIKTFNA